MAQWLWLATAALAIVAAPCCRGAGLANAPRMQEEPRYNPGTVVKVEGFVQDIHENADPDSLTGLYISLKTEKETVEVYLGPVDFIRSFEIAFKKGDHVEAIGSKVKHSGSTVLLAREVRRYGSTLYLRDERGTPYWRQ